LITNN